MLACIPHWPPAVLGLPHQVLDWWQRHQLQPVHTKAVKVHFIRLVNIINKCNVGPTLWKGGVREIVCSCGNMHRNETMTTKYNYKLNVYYLFVPRLIWEDVVMIWMVTKIRALTGDSLIKLECEWKLYAQEVWTANNTNDSECWMTPIWWYKPTIRSTLSKVIKDLNDSTQWRWWSS